MIKLIHPRCLLASIAVLTACQADDDAADLGLQDSQVAEVVLGSSLDQEGSVSDAFSPKRITGHELTGWSGATISVTLSSSRSANPVLLVLGPKRDRTWVGASTVEIADRGGEGVPETIQFTPEENGIYVAVAFERRRQPAPYSMAFECLDGCAPYDRVLGPPDFATGTAALDSVAAFSGRYDGVISVLNLDRATVESALPEPLALAPLTDPTVTDHPVLSYAVTQRDVSDGQVTLAPYRELIIAVPYVVHPGSTQPFIYSVTMVLTDEDAVAIGNVFGYNKHLATYRSADGARSSFADADGALMAELQPYHTSDAFVGLGALTPDLSHVLTILADASLPWVGMRPDGTLTCSSFAFDPFPIEVAPAASYTVLHPRLIEVQDPARAHLFDQLPWAGDPAADGPVAVFSRRHSFQIRNANWQGFDTACPF